MVAIDRQSRPGTSRGQVTLAQQPRVPVSEVGRGWALIAYDRGVGRATGAHRGASAVAAFGVFLTVSFCYFALPVLAHPGRDIIGSGHDPQLFVWSLAWWPHAVLHGQNPFVSHVLWAPVGANLVWSTSIPGLAFLLAPVTVAAGPVVAYNVAAVLLPALAGLTAFLLCRHVTRSFWASVAGGYVFGFSSFMLGHELAHLHLTSSFLVPLAALLVLRFLEGGLDGRGLVWRLAPVLVFQFLFGTEMFFMLALCLVVGAGLAWAVVPRVRGRLRQGLRPVLGAYAACAVVLAPFLYYAVTSPQGVVTPTTTQNPDDLVTFAFPTTLSAVGGQLAVHFVNYNPPVTPEAGQYLGLPTLAIIGLFALRRRRRPGSRFLLLALVLAALATLGPQLRVRAHNLFPLPWRAVQSLPLFDNTLPARFALFVSLIVCLIVAIWAAGPTPRRWLRIALTIAAVVALVPRLSKGAWHSTPPLPTFVTDRLYRDCLAPGTNVLVLPPPFRNSALLWQTRAGFRFGLADGGLNDDVPTNDPDRATMLRELGNNVPPGGARALLAAARADHVDAIAVYPASDAQWTSLLDPVIHRHIDGGVALYPLTPLAPGCGHT